MHRTIPRGVAFVAAAVLVLLALPALATAPVSTGDGAWVWQTPQPEGNTLYAVACPDGLHAWTVGGAGTLLKSTNGGRTWALGHSGVGVTLYGVTFADATHGWACGARGVVIATTNGGRTWNRARTGVSSSVDLAAITCVGRQHVWAVGNDASNGYLLRSTDAGKHWTVAEKASTTLNAIDFGDSTHGCAVGDSALLLYTRNGGRTWSTAADPLTATPALAQVSMATRSVGWAAGSQYDSQSDQEIGYMFRTTDGGAHWTFQATMGDAWRYFGLNAVSATHCYAGYAADGVNQFMLTTDGTTWGNGGHQLSDYALVGMTVNSHAHGIAVGYGSLALTSTNFMTWTKRLPHGAVPFVDTIAFADARHGWAVGEHGDLLHTTDAGVQWQAQTPPASTTTSYYDCAVRDAQHAWVVGYGGMVMATTDGGTHWATQASNLSPSLWGVRFWDDEHGITVGGSTTAVAAYTTDGGATWTPSSPGVAKVAFGVTYRDAQDAIMVGSAGLAAVSTDGGTTWRTLTPLTTERLLSVSFADPDNGWTVGDDGAVYATTDGGTTWQAQHCGTTRTLREVTCASPSRAWAVTDSGGVHATLDGGAHWLAQKPGTDANLFSVDFVNATHGFIGGSAGIFATTTGAWHVTGRPVTKALAPATVGSSNTTTLRFEVLEHGAPGNIATVTIRIRTLAGKLVMTLPQGDVKVGVKHAVGLMLHLKKGHYRWYVSAADAAGHTAKAPAWNTLTVK